MPAQKLFCRSILTMSIVILGACTAQTNMPGADVRALSLPTEISSPQAGLLRAWQGEDITVFQPYFADHAVIVTPDGRFTGWTEIRTRWIEPALPAMSNYVSTPTAITHEGNDIIETGTYSYTNTAGTAVRTVRGTYAHRWSQMPDGSWRIVSATIQ
jgi:hypothetical protein